MARIPFGLKWKPQIESGEYKVETRDGEPVRIICWDMVGTYPIVALCKINEGEWPFTYDINGHYHKEGPDKYDLYLVTPEEELSDFEIRSLDWLSDDTSGEIPIERMKEVVRNRAAELRSLVREELENEAPSIIEAQSFREGFKVGKAKALKDLPRWKRDDSIEAEQYITVGKNGERFHYKGHSLLISDLTKLPGFKED